jgi:hypothetical protein
MPDPVTEFFERVGSRPFEPRLAWADDAMRFDLRDGERVEHWLITINRGSFRVLREERPAGVVVTVDRALFGRMVEGTSNVYSAWLRDELRIAGGNPTLFFAFWRLPRLVPSPPDGHHPRSLVEPRPRSTPGPRS